MTVDELVMLVSTALGFSVLSECEAGSDNVPIGVAEIISAVNAAQNECRPAPDPTASPTMTPPPCGDGLIEPPETCDCGHPCVGCDSNCQVESGYFCSGEPSLCFIVDGCGQARPTCPTGLPFTPTATPTPKP